MKEKLEVRKKNAKDEFEEIIRTYMLPLLDTRGNLKLKDRSGTNLYRCRYQAKDVLLVVNKTNRLFLLQRLDII